ncbi:MAG TPA: phosphopantetheine-binding protein, partial [Spirochaetota bacterium]|nr:phosphopantetheine-binding protein [Spirochaetota bacterium]
GKICEKFGIAVPEDLKLTEFNTIAKLSGFISSAAGISDAPAAAAQTATSSAASSAGSTAAASDGGAFVKDVTRIIAEMTGYGEDMLDPNLDLEGDLGIDTVKQVEIFGKVCEHYGLSVPEDLKLSELNTIAKLAAFIATLKNGGPTPPTGGGNETPSGSGPAQKDYSIKRFVVRPEKADLPKGDTNLFSGKKVMITSDSKGVAKKIGELITARGATVTLLGKDDVDFGDVKAVQAKAEALAANGVDGLIHLMPLDGYYNGKKTDKKTTDASVKSLFALVKALQSSLNKDGAFVATVTFDSVIFPYNDPKADIYPVFGALSGMLKSVNKEFAKTLVKTVDFSSAYSGKIDDVADMFVKELVSGDTKVEIGYKNGERFRITITEEKVSGSGSFVKEGDTVLLSGGARGITFEILKEMVKTYKVNPVILARSPIDTIDPEFTKEGIDEKAIFNSLAAKMTGAKPLEIKKAAAKVMNQLDTIKN